MNNIKIMNRHEVKSYSAHKEISETAIISIYSPGSVPCRFFKNERIKAVGKWCFEDSLDGRGISKEQSKQISEFVLRNKDVDTLVVHCDDGISRSAGIAAAISQWAFGKSLWAFKSPRYIPNMRCYYFMIESLYKIE